MTTTATHQTLHVLNHPVVNHHLAALRDERTDSATFRQALSLVGSALIQAASAGLPTKPVTIRTPLTETSVKQIEGRVVLVPILRAGLALVDPALAWLPMAHVHALGMARNEKTLEPESYYNRLAAHESQLKASHCFILDPMLATGGSAVAAINALEAIGIAADHIHLVCVLASPEGVKHVAEHAPAVTIWTAALDSHLNEHGFIVPGLGDAGDRAFNT